MIAFLHGIVRAKTLQKAYLDVHGIGFEVTMSTTSINSLPDIGLEATIYTYMAVREDDVSLFGFSSTEEKELFEKLITVSGIGPKVAIAALSYYAPADLIAAIQAQDVARVSKIPGVGKKTASRIILELKGSFDMVPAGQMALGDAQDAAAVSPASDGVKEALLSMGFTQTEIDLALKGAPESANESTLLQYALKRLGSL